jgi:hypothetical protein
MKRHEWEMKPRISLPWNPTSALTEVSPLWTQYWLVGMLCAT